MRLRQVVLVARRLEAALADLTAVLGIDVGYRDPGVAVFGLENAVMPVGDTFLEVVSPVEAHATAARYLERRGSDGGYMVMVQTEDADADRARAARLGIRVVWSADLDDIRGTHLHPRDVGGAILSLDTPVPPESWRWAGPEWRRHVRTDVVRTITAVELRAADPEALAQRWSEVLARPAVATGPAAWAIALDQGTIRFVAARDPRDEGVGAFDVVVADRDQVLAAARARGLACDADHVCVCDTDVRLVPHA